LGGSSGPLGRPAFDRASDSGLCRRRPERRVPRRWGRHEHATPLGCRAPAPSERLRAPLPGRGRPLREGPRGARGFEGRTPPSEDGGGVGRRDGPRKGMRSLRHTLLRDLSAPACGGAPGLLARAALLPPPRPRTLFRPPTFRPRSLLGPRLGWGGVAAAHGRGAGGGRSGRTLGPFPDRRKPLLELPLAGPGEAGVRAHRVSVVRCGGRYVAGGARGPGAGNGCRLRPSREAEVQHLPPVSPVAPPRGPSDRRHPEEADTLEVLLTTRAP